MLTLWHDVQRTIAPQPDSHQDEALCRLQNNGAGLQ